jgi:hypothetical protein
MVSFFMSKEGDVLQLIYISVEIALLSFAVSEITA